MVGVVGLDACKERWVALRLADGSFAGASVHPTLAEVVRHHQRCVIIAIDIPIGLPGAVMWIRPADVEARRFVGPRRSSVFMTLPKVVLDAPSHQAAIRVCQAHNEAKISA